MILSFAQTFDSWVSEWVSEGPLNCHLGIYHPLSTHSLWSMMIFWGEFQCVVSYHFKKKKIEYGSKSKCSPHLKNQRSAFPIWESSLLLRSPKCFFCTASHFFALHPIIAIVQMWRACSSDGRLEQCGLTREKSAGNPSGLCISIWKVQN